MQTPGLDIFSLGCVWFFVLSHGRHPFGSGTLIEANILNQKCRLASAEVETNTTKYLPMIQSMLSNDPKIRPNCKHVLDFMLQMGKDSLKIDYNLMRLQTGKVISAISAICFLDCRQIHYSVCLKAYIIVALAQLNLIWRKIAFKAGSLGVSSVLSVK